MNHPIPDAALSQHILIVGMVGSGKTYTAKGLAENIIRAGQRTCIIDPLGVWVGLRSSASGDGPGLPVLIFGGEHADIPITDRMGAAVASIIADPETPASIIDLSEMSGGEMKRFMTAFCTAIYKANRAPLHLIIDEADEFAPQQPMPDATVLSGEMDRIVRRGRARGFRVTMITQRPAVLHKNVVTQAATLVALRLVSKQDRDAVDGWIKGVADAAEGKRVLAELPGLATGQGWVWSPQAGVLDLVTFPPITTYDSSKTPEHGDDRPTPTLAGIDVDAIAARLADLAEPAQEEKPKRAVQGFTSAQMDAAQKEAHADGRKVGYGEGFAAAVEKMRATLHEMAPQGEFTAPERMNPPVPEKPRAPTAERPAKISGGGAARMLNVLISRAPAKLTRSQLATLAGLSPRSGSYRNYLSQLRQGDMIEEAGQEVWASNYALANAGVDRPAPQSAEEVRAMWRQALGGGGVQRMFDHLVSLQGQSIHRERLAVFVDMSSSSGSFRNYLSALRRNGLLVETKAGQVALSPDLFEEPRQ